MQYLAGIKRLRPPRFYICNGAYTIITFRGQFIQPTIQPIDGSGWPGILSSRNCIPFRRNFTVLRNQMQVAAPTIVSAIPAFAMLCGYFIVCCCRPTRVVQAVFQVLIHPVLLRLGALSHPCLLSPRLRYIYRI